MEHAEVFYLMFSIANITLVSIIIYQNKNIKLCEDGRLKIMHMQTYKVCITWTNCMQHFLQTASLPFRLRQLLSLGV